MKLIDELRRALADGALGEVLSDLTADEWRELLEAAELHRCIRCGETDNCECPD